MRKVRSWLEANTSLEQTIDIRVQGLETRELARTNRVANYASGALFSAKISADMDFNALIIYGFSLL